MRQVSFVKKIICSILVLSLTLQGCTVYRKNPVTLQEASEQYAKVRITRIDGKKVRFVKITKIDSSYYGVKWVRGEKVRLPINPTDVSIIRVVNKSASLWANIAIAVGTLGIGVLIYILSQPVLDEDATFQLE